MPDRASHVTALDDHLRALEVAVEDNAEHDIWMQTKNVLAWLYHFEEWYRVGEGASYYRHRGASANGQTLAGLIYLRGRLEHSHLDVRELGWQRLHIANVSPDGEWQPAQILWVNAQGEWVNASIEQIVRVCPQRSTLPHPSKREKHG